MYYVLLHQQKNKAPTSSHVNFMSEFKAEPSLSENHRKHEQQTLTNYTTNSDEFEGMYSLKTVVGNTTEYEMFKLFLQNNNAFFDIQCWMDIEAYS